ncbi:MAG: hypothetical protein ABIH56_06505 [Candidatus Margulisiibacteriota bacterium]
MLYDLGEFYKKLVISGNKKIESSNGLSNEVTKQILTCTTFLLIFISSFIVLFKDRLCLQNGLSLFSIDIKYLIIVVIASALVSVLSGVISLKEASFFLLRNARADYDKAAKIQKQISEKKEMLGELPFSYNLNDHLQASWWENLLNWINITLFIVSVVLGIIIIVYLLLQL